MGEPIALCKGCEGSVRGMCAMGGDKAGGSTSSVGLRSIASADSAHESFALPHAAGRGWVEHSSGRRGGG